jgi:hypothetical protein
VVSTTFCKCFCTTIGFSFFFAVLYCFIECHKWYCSLKSGTPQTIKTDRVVFPCAMIFVDNVFTEKTCKRPGERIGYVNNTKPRAYSERSSFFVNCFHRSIARSDKRYAVPYAV